MPHTPARPDVPRPRQLLSVSTVRGPRPGRVVVEAVGEVDTYTAPALDACLRSQATQPGVRELIVDLGRVTSLDPAATTVLARAHRRCRIRGARLEIRTGGRESVLQALQLTGLAGLVTTDTVPVAEDGVARLPAAHGRR